MMDVTLAKQKVQSLIDSLDISKQENRQKANRMLEFLDSLDNVSKIQGMLDYVTLDTTTIDDLINKTQFHVTVIQSIQ